MNPVPWPPFHGRLGISYTPSCLRVGVTRQPSLSACHIAVGQVPVNTGHSA